MELGPLLDRARAGDRDSWNALLGRLRPYVRALLRRLVRQDADASDLTQKVQWRMDQGFGRFRGETTGQLLAWVRQIAARVWLDHLGRPPPPDPLPPDPVSPRPAAGSSLVRAEETARLAKALERLPEHYRRVIEARLHDGLPCAEIARRMGRSAEWVRVVSKRAVERLREDRGEKP